MTFREKVVLNALIWACVYPSVMMFSYAFRWLGIDVPLWAEIGISTAVSVPLISSVCAPRIEAAIARAEGSTPAEFKMRQAKEVAGEAPPQLPRRPRPLQGGAE